MEKLLLRQEAKSHALDYIRKLLYAFEQDRFDSNSESIPKSTVETTTKAFASLPNPLTLREQEIIELLSKRLSNQEIADRLFISLETVKRHIANMYRNLPDRSPWPP